MMTIRDFAAATGLSDSAIRYYERMGILQPAGRSSSGYREFDDDDVQWADFVIRLRDTGMKLSRIVEFSRLRRAGDSSLPQRRKILEDHEKDLIADIGQRTMSLEKLRDKIALYQNI